MAGATDLHPSLEGDHDDLESDASTIAPSSFSSHASTSDMLKYYIPVVGWLPSYDFARNGFTDFLAGLTVAVMIIPQAIAYSSLIGLPPIYGLFTSFYPMLIYTLLGSSRQMSVGPETTSAILLSHVLSKYAATLDPTIIVGSDAYIQLLVDQTFRVTVLAGALGLLMGLARVGFVDSILSQPILQGFIFSIALLLITDQTPKLLGIPLTTLPPDAHGPTKWVYTFNHLSEMNSTTAFISFLTIFTLFAMKYLKASEFAKNNKWFAAFPELLFVLIFATLSSKLFSLSDRGVECLGSSVQGGFVPPRFVTMTSNEVSELLSSSMSIAIIGFINSGVVSRILAQKYDYLISSNRELVALGSANLISSFFGAFPAYGSLLRTKVADQAGATSQIYSCFCALIVAVVAAYFLPFISSMPKAVIASLVVFVALSLLDITSLTFLYKLGDKRDMYLCLSMVVVTFFFGVDVGIFFAFSACLLLLVRQTNTPAVALLGRHPLKENEYVDLNDSLIHAQKIPDVFLVRISGQLHFANATPLKSALDRLERFSDIHAHPGSRPHPYFDTREPYQESAVSPSSGRGRSRGEHGSYQAGLEFQQSPGLSSSSSSSSSAASSSTTRVARQSVVLDLSDCLSADSSAINLLLDMLRSYERRHLLVLLVLRRPELHDRFLAAGCEAFVSGVFRTVHSAVQYAEGYRINGFKSVGGYESFQIGRD